MSVATESPVSTPTGTETVENTSKLGTSNKHTYIAAEGEALQTALKKQLEYYFSKANLMNDRYLLTQMNSELFVPIKVIAGFNLVKALTTDYDAVVAALKSLESVSLDETGTLVRPNWKPHRNMIILREIATSTPEEEIRSIFTPEHLSKISEIKPDINDFWYITFSDDDSAIGTLEYLREQKFKGQPIKARLKTENTFRSLYASAVASTVVPNQQEQTAQAINYVPVPNQNWADVPYDNNVMGYNTQQWENVDPNYKPGYDNRRGGYRKGGRSYNSSSGRGGRGGYRGQGNKDSQNNQNARKRRDSGGNPAVLQFSNAQHFPPLPSQQKDSGYTKDYKHYAKQQMVDIVLGLKVTKPSIPPEGKVVETETNTELQVTKPWPQKTHSDTPAESSSSTTESPNSMSLPIKESPSTPPQDQKK